MPKLNAHLGYQFTEFEPMQRFHQAAQAGFKAVEWPAIYPYDPERLREIIDSLDLRWISVSVPFGSEKGVAALAGREDEFRRGLREAIRYAKALDAAWIHPMAGRVAQWDEGARKTYLSNIRRAVNEAAAHGLGTLIEVIGEGEVPGYAMCTYDRADEVIGEIGSDSLKAVAGQLPCPDGDWRRDRARPALGRANRSRADRGRAGTPRTGNGKHRFRSVFFHARKRRI
jgi:hydroxypyruvate isomerase